MFVKDGGIRYEGNFIDGRFCGQGFGKYPNGDMYVGEWKDNAKHGEGMIYFEDGS
jgi:radial spoke head protein 1